jgi:hypothetical protein
MLMGFSFDQKDHKIKEAKEGYITYKLKGEKNQFKLLLSSMKQNQVSLTKWTNKYFRIHRFLPKRKL